MIRDIGRFQVLACLLLLGCSRAAGTSNDPDGVSGKIVITGSSTAAPLVTEIAKRFESRHPGLRIDVQTGGSSRGIADAVSGLADLGMSSRDLTTSEQSGRRVHTLAWDGIGFLVHDSNPTSQLTHEQLLGIYTGEIRNWKLVGGRDAPITVVSRADGRSELDLVTEHLGLRPSDISADLICGENQHALKTVAGDPNAIVYISVGASAYERERGAPIRLLSLGGVAATTANVQTREYPLSRPLLLVTTPEPTPSVSAFLGFALSEVVHDLVEEHAFVPVQ